jgi:hypothetical protein
MAGNRRLGEVRRIHPNVVFTAMMVQHASVPAQVAFEAAEVHLAIPRRGRRQSAQQFKTRLLERLGGVSRVGKCLLNGLGLRNQFRVERRSHYISTFLSRFEVQDESAVAHRVARAHLR